MELGDRALGLLLLLFSSTLFAYYTFWVIITVSVTSTSLSLCPSLSLCHCPPLFLCVSVSFCFSLPQISVGSCLSVLGFFVLDLYVVMFCSFVGLSFDVCVCVCSHLWTQITLFTTTFLHENMPSSFLALLELHSSPLCLSLWES
jgi:hypothetical protein